MLQSLICENLDETRHLPIIATNPNLCPCCSTGISPDFIRGYFYPNLSLREGMILNVWQVFWCPNCENLFLKSFSAQAHALTSRIGQWELRELDYTVKLYPIPSSNTAFSSGIKSLSPSFVKIYHQSEKAENEGLDEICGVGYRKSIEFLVKDYLCSEFPEESDKIKSEFLGVAINRIGNERIRVLASRATWIGNDETHYIRKHENSDVKQMKRFINAMVHFLDSEFAFKEAEEMESK